MGQDRSANVHVIRFEAGSDTSHIIDLGNGCFGTFIAATGSDAVGKSIQVVALPSVTANTPEQFPATDLLSVPKTLAAGSNAITSDEIVEVGAATRVQFRLSAPVATLTNVWLLWKSSNDMGNGRT